MEFTFARNIPGRGGLTPLRRRRTREPALLPRRLLIHLAAPAKNTVPLTKISRMTVERITKKLAGHSKETALWVSSVGNELGQILNSVLTGQEGPGLDRMAAGLMERYRQAGVAPPMVLCVDCGCCITEGLSKLQARFGEWPDLHIRLDIWHFMRRLAVGCTTDAHPLYPAFMRALSSCIFEWDAGDLDLLQRSKTKQLQQEQRPGITRSMVDSQITKKELSTFCRRRTRGEEATLVQIERLLEELRGPKGRDLMGVPLLDEVRMDHIWRVQKRHIKCIQDVPGIQLYTEVGSMNKSGIKLTSYRCARGSTSLESFHCHLNRFIPGTSTNLLNFQLYLLEGLNRWNQDWGTAAVSGKPSCLLTYAGDINNNSLKVLGREYVPNFTPPAKYTGNIYFPCAFATESASASAHGNTSTHLVNTFIITWQNCFSSHLVNSMEFIQI
ncbi:uncharacterized protein PAE49_017568 isoform 3-T6 [Odontesthes bonariensis]|uniref:uncharacterized protein LOC142401503 isoform X3 n=2 Tax=Odontesthes bonariensis TaxID=219752 RepID=UPI003F58DAFC